ncbi:MAG: hypothetical protein V4724_02205 [Pseudomonadota bacterium]
MNATKLIAALTVFAATASAFAADAPQAASTKPVLLASAATDTGYANVSFPSALVKKDSARSRAEVKAEAIEAARTHQSTLLQQLASFK